MVRSVATVHRKELTRFTLKHTFVYVNKNNHPVNINNATREDSMKHIRNITVAEVQIDDLILVGEDTALNVEMLGRDGKKIQIAGVDPDGRDTMVTAPGHMVVLLVVRPSELN